MLSFSKVITFAVVSFGTLSQAVLLSPREVSIGARVSGPVQLSGFLTALKTQLVVAVAPISTVVQFTVDVVNLGTDSLSGNNATASFVLPILEDVNNILNVAAKHLVAEPVDELFEDMNDALLTVDEVFCLLTVVFEVLEIICQLITDLSELLKILPILVDAITVLQNIITAVVFGNVLVLVLVIKIRTFAASNAESSSPFDSPVGTPLTITTTRSPLHQYFLT